MGFFDKVKNAVGNRLGNEVAKKIDPPGTSYGSSSGKSTTTSSYQSQNDPAHDAKVEALRKQNELRGLELEAQMQERVMGKGGLIDKQTALMDAAAQSLNEQNKPKK